jgi:hypothetical protein
VMALSMAWRMSSSEMPCLPALGRFSTATAVVETQSATRSCESTADQTWWRRWESNSRSPACTSENWRYRRVSARTGSCRIVPSSRGVVWTGRHRPDRATQPGAPRIDTFLIHRRPPAQAIRRRSRISTETWLMYHRIYQRAPATSPKVGRTSSTGDHQSNASATDPRPPRQPRRATVQSPVDGDRSGTGGQT